MLYYYFIVVIFLLFNSLTLSMSSYYPTDIPNPNIDPTKCNRQNIKRSAICDIDNLLSEESKNVIEGYINSINNNAEIGIGIISKMNDNYITAFKNDIDIAAKNFAKSLHDSWKVGNIQSNNGIVIFLSINDRVVFISTGKGVKDKLKDYLIDNIIDKMRPYLKNTDFGSAIELSLIHIDTIISNGKSNLSSEKFNIPWYQNSDIQGWIFFILFTVGLIIYSYYHFQKMRKLEKGEEALQKLMKEVKNARDDNTDEQQPYLTSSCPICFEDFPNNSNLESPDDSKDLKRPMSLQCGHVFCFACLDQFLKSKPSHHVCPICRAPANKDEPKQPDQPRSNRRNSSNDANDGTSCFHQSNRQTVYMRRVPELRYRAYNLNRLYPDVVTQGILRNLNTAFDDGSSPEIVTTIINNRVAGVRQMIRSNREGFQQSGSRGSRISFGGGSSFGGGGRGGRW